MEPHPKKKVCILDYGSGNIRSVFNLCSAITDTVEVSNEEEVVVSATHLILPGVGAFGAAMEKIREKIPLQAVERAVFERRIPFLGICVGMQVLAERGYEFGEHQGLGWIPGSVKKLEVGELPLPHIGWNSAETAHPSPLLEGIPSGEDFYFVHSFVFDASDPSSVAATTHYGSVFVSVIASGNIFGVQFHPEKSQRAGRRLLANFINLA